MIIRTNVKPEQQRHFDRPISGSNRHVNGSFEPSPSMSGYVSPHNIERKADDHWQDDYAQFDHVNKYLGMTLDFIYIRPFQTIGTVLALLLFLLVSYNLAFGQANKHPAPLFSQSSTTDEAEAASDSVKDTTSAISRSENVNPAVPGIELPNPVMITPAQAWDDASLSQEISQEIEKQLQPTQLEEKSLDTEKIEASVQPQPANAWHFQRPKKEPQPQEASQAVIVKERKTLAQYAFSEADDQQAHKLREAALASNQNLALLEGRPLERADIVAIQEALRRQGLYKGEIDGLAGRKTREAILSFEKKLGLPETGEASRKLLSALIQFSKVDHIRFPQIQSEDEIFTGSIQPSVQHSNKGLASGANQQFPNSEATSDAMNMDGNEEITAPIMSTDLLMVEQYLTRLGYDCGTIDGFYDSHTKDAIREFQAAHGLRQTGFLFPDLIIAART